MTDPVIKEAIRLRDGLKAVEREFGYRFPGQKAHAELNAMDAKTCADAAEMLTKLGTEVTRLRLCIEHFDCGRLDRRELVAVVRNWNCDPSVESKDHD